MLQASRGRHPVSMVLSARPCAIWLHGLIVQSIAAFRGTVRRMRPLLQHVNTFYDMHTHPSLLLLMHSAHETSRKFARPYKLWLNQCGCMRA